MEKVSKKIQILNASESLFLQLGFEGTSTRAIAKSASVNIAMINYYFGSKEGLFATVMVRLLQQFGIQLIDIDRQSISTKEKVYRVFNAYVESVLNKPEIFLIIYKELNCARNSKTAELISDRLYQNYNAMVQLLKRGIQEGVFKEVEVYFVVANIKGVLMHNILVPNKIIHSAGLGLETPTLKAKTINSVQKYVRQLLDAMLVGSN